MPLFVPQELTLHPHPDTPGAGVAEIRVDVGSNEAGGLGLRYHIVHAPGAVRLPAEGERLPRDRLWAHTCCEVFVAEDGETAYREFNFSPTDQWMRFDFSDYRVRQAVELGPAPQLAQTRSADTWTLSARIPAQALPSGPAHLALTVVIEHSDGTYSYWALGHPADKPDFHHRGGFLLPVRFPWEPESAGPTVDHP